MARQITQIEWMVVMCYKYITRNTLKWVRNRSCSVSVLLQVETRQVNQRRYSHMQEDNLV